MMRSAFEDKVAALGLPYAPIAKPEDLFDDPHLLASGGLLSLELPDGRTAPTPALPFEMDGRRFGIRRGIPIPGQHTDEVLAEIRLAKVSRTRR